MFRILKEIRPFIWTILIIIALLFVQAMTELALPSYMSNIVDVGIGQNGIENAVPEAIREEEMGKIKALSNPDENSLIDANYKLVNKEDLTEEQSKKYLKRYPSLENENLYILQKPSQEDIEELDSFLGKTMLIISGIQEGGTLGSDMGDLPQGMDPFAALENLPEEQFGKIRAKIEEHFEDMPDSIINQSAISYIKSQYDIIGIDVQKNQSRYILNIGGVMILIALLSMGVAIIVGFLSARVSSSLGRDLREKVFTKVASFSNAEFDKFSTASLITRSTNDIQQIQMFTVMLLRMVFYAPIIGIGGIIRALRTNTSMAWIVAIGVLAILTLVIIIFSIATPKFKRLQKLVDRVNLVMREALSGILVIRAFNTQDYQEKRFDNANKDLTRTNLFVSRIMATMMPSIMLIMNAISLLIMWFGAHQIDSGGLQVGDMMAFIQYAMQIIMSFLMLSMISIILPRASVSAQRIGEVLDEDIMIKDPADPKSLNPNPKKLLEFKDVSFRYPGAEEGVLENVSFTARSGETIAFIGSTGSGKSTLINLIPRFYDVTEGQILLDGIDIRDIKLQDLRDRIGYVPQNSVLFSGTIESNLKYGKNSMASQEDVEKAIDISQAKEFVYAKDNDLESEISQGGTNVSGGQRQRLSIARALTKNPEVLIFDDSFSALDFKTDATLRGAMDREIKDSIVLIVAQRINTIMNAENIIVLDEGKIVGMGRHKELLKTCSVYKQIALSQLSEEELAI